MLRVLFVFIVLGSVAACEQSAEPAALSSPPTDAEEDTGAGLLVDGPTDPVEFACADGRQAMVRAYMGGVIVAIDGQSYQMPQISVPGGARGYYHQLGDLGWFEDEEWNGHLISIGPGQSIQTGSEVFCERVGPMWWELDDVAS
jgi:hypothetical protein